MLGRVFLGRYEATRLLGEGGMGRVYLANQLDLGRHVVVKVMHDHVACDPKFRERFQRETLLMARFQHPYAVTLYDASLNDPQGPCIVMEYIRGVTLDTLLQSNGRLSAPRVARLLGQLCEALQAAHGMGIIHRDLKPTNLMVVDPDTPYEKIKVMDFGLAKLVASPSPLYPGSDSNTEFAVGTPGYISPEQVRGEEMDHRGDLYSVGVILFEMLSGRLPFADRPTMDILLAHATEPPPSFTEVGAADWVPASVEAVVLACLAKEPAGRPANARDLAERFETALAHEVVVHDRNGEAGPKPQDGERNGHSKLPPTLKTGDPSLVIHYLEAWMPEAVAAYKLRGFVNDAGGEVVQSVPGLIRVRLGGRGSAYRHPGTGALSWLGLGRKPGFIDVELHLERSDPTRESMLAITVAMRSSNGHTALDAGWRARCNQVYCDLRAYLMGQNGSRD
jgi:serine/threonine-protein kinase